MPGRCDYGRPPRAKSWAQQQRELAAKQAASWARIQAASAKAKGWS